MPKKDNIHPGQYIVYRDDTVEGADLGLLVLPVSDGPPVVIRTHEPYALNRQRFKARKRKTPPISPAPRPDDSQSTLIAASVSIPLPTPSSLKPPEMTYSVAGEYLYVRPAYIPNGDTELRVPAASPHKTGIQNAGYPSTGRPFDYVVIDQAGVNSGVAADPLAAVIPDAQIATGTWE